MGDPRGFLKVRTRRELAERPVEERIKDWFDVHAETGLQPWTQAQAARCMDCGTPFCMTGCPLGNLIPEWNDLVRQGKWEDACNRLSMTNNFPEVTGRICPALCEQACVLGIHQPPTMIRNDECTIIDQAWDLDIVKPLPPQRLTDQGISGTQYDRIADGIGEFHTVFHIFNDPGCCTGLTDALHQVFELLTSFGVTNGSCGST